MTHNLVLKFGAPFAIVWLSCAAFASSTPVANSPHLGVIDPIVRETIEEQQVPGAVILVWHDGHVIYRKAFGHRSLEPRQEIMTADTIFDVASLTKVIATTTAVMQLVEQGKIRLNDPVGKYLPEFAQNDKDDITVRELMTHHSGLREDLDLTTDWRSRDFALSLVAAEKPISPPGSRYLYSDINFISLGALVERVSGQPLNEYCEKHIFQPLGMTHTRFLPPPTWLPKIAPTQYDERNRMLRGVVHDPTSRRMGGVAGHAGLFSTVDDLARFAEALLNGSSILSSLTVEKMTTPQQPPTSTVLRGLGWDIDSPFSSNRGDLLPVGSFGHTGFTGTSIWIDPTTRAFIVILTNGVHPRGKGTAVPLRSKVTTAVTAALHLNPEEKETLRLESITGYNETQTAARRVANRNGDVKAGIDVLEAHNFDVIAGTGGVKKRIGVLTNQTGVDLQGQRTIDVLAHAPGVALTAIFSPEHGVTGTLDTTDINNSKDAATGVPVYSVYGAKKAERRPPFDILKTLDAVVIDIQHAGTRFYTYEASMGYFLEAAAQVGIDVVVLDRPSPITGSFVQGPMSDSGRESFVNYYPEPLRHGMTMGELARYYNGERKLNARLKVVPLEGWVRGDWLDATGLQWIAPSPNLRTLNENTLYPGVGLIEGTNVSVGRGTDTPFELLGAPWIKGRELARYLNARNISGVRFVSTSFTPTTSNYSGQRCEGVNLVVTERNALDSPELGVELASALRKLYPNDWHMEKLIDLVVNQSVYDAIAQGQDPRRIAQDWQPALDDFQKLRQNYLIYK